MVPPLPIAAGTPRDFAQPRHKPLVISQLWQPFKGAKKYFLRKIFRRFEVLRRAVAYRPNQSRMAIVQRSERARVAAPRLFDQLRRLTHGTSRVQGFGPSDPFALQDAGDRQSSTAKFPAITPGQEPELRNQEHFHPTAISTPRSTQ
jgi:hypothetical protein